MPATTVTQIPDIFELTGATLEGKYSIERPVAAGGFGVVYRAHHNALDRPVAIKVLKLSDALGDEGRRAVAQLFEREAQTIARLNHPAIVQVIDYGATPMPDGRVSPWMVLEWLDGVTLSRHLDDLGRARMSPKEALALLRPAFEALAMAHARGIAHRDIKPGNFMCVLDWRGATTLRVLDFGIARAMSPDEVAGSGETQTHATIAPFSPSYGAPEQVSRARTGPWTDVHALALVLVELLIGGAPYPCDDTTAMCGAALSPERPTPRRFGVDVGEWEPILARALSLRPWERFADAGAFLADLDAALPDAVPAATHVDPPTPAAPDPALQPVVRALPWRGLAFAAVAVVALAAGVSRLSRRAAPPPATPTPPRALEAAPSIEPTTVTAVLVAQPPPAAASDAATVAPTPAPRHVVAAPSTPRHDRVRHAPPSTAPTAPAAPTPAAPVVQAPPAPCVGADCRHTPE